MHYYACPYCAPNPKARLKKVMAKGLTSKYNKEELCEDKHKCKEVMECEKCGEQWTVLKSFLKEQKRKIKDG